LADQNAKQFEHTSGQKSVLPVPSRLVTHMTNDLDQIWKALSDETRRTILDFLRSGPKPTTAIVEQFPDLSRFAVMKHLDVLRQAALVVTREDGRQRINSLNAVPIRMIYERWVSNYEGIWANALLRVKEASERNAAVPPSARAAKNSKGKQKQGKASRIPPGASPTTQRVRTK
jgi:DNA-binding transcriptional ArsR family regulator